MLRLWKVCMSNQNPTNKVYQWVWINLGASLTHWGRVTHICVSKLTIVDSDDGLLPGRRQVIIRTNAGIWLIRALGTNFSKILSHIHTYSFKKMQMTMSSAKWWQFCLGLNGLTDGGQDEIAAILQTTFFRVQSSLRCEKGIGKLSYLHNTEGYNDSSILNRIEFKVCMRNYIPKQQWT